MLTKDYEQYKKDGGGGDGNFVFFFNFLIFYNFRLIKNINIRN